MRSPRGDIFFNTFSVVMLLLFFNTEVLYIPQQFQFNKEKPAVLGRAIPKSSRSQTQWNFDQILKFVRSAGCLQPFGIQIGIQPQIFCLHLMYLLFERCITGLILVSYPTVVLCVSLCTHSTILFSLLFCYLLSFAVLRSFNHLSFIVTLLSSYLLGTKFLYYRFNLCSLFRIYLHLQGPVCLLLWIGNLSPHHLVAC